MLVFEWLGEVTGQIASAFLDRLTGLLKFKPEQLKDIDTELAVKSLDPSKFKTPEVRKFVEDLKKELSSSPSGLAEWAQTALGPMFEGIYTNFIGAIVPGKMPDFESAQKAGGYLTFLMADFVILSAAMDMVATAFSGTLVRNLAHICRLFAATFGMDRYLDVVVAPAFGAGLVPRLAQGYNEQYQAQMPGSGDLIRMELREVFRPEFRPGLLTPSPSGDFYGYMAKLGFSKEWADSYWAAHWALPSVTQAFEMFHRIPEFTEDDLRTLLRRQDVLQEYHDNIIKIAYTPFTRVDIRRMYNVGVLDRAGVKRAYLDIGYDEQKAELITDFTVKLQASSDRELTKSDILTAYKKGTVDDATTRELLGELDYDEDEIEFLLANADAGTASASRDLTVSNYRQLYQLGIQSKAEVTEALARLGFDAQEIELQYKLWDVETPPKVTQPSRTDLKNFYKLGIIDEKTWHQEMTNLGYGDKYRAWYAQALAAELEE